MGILTEPKERLINSLNLCILECPLIGTLDYTHMSNTYFSVLNNYIQNHSFGCSGICGHVSVSGYYSPGRNMLCLQGEFAKFLWVRKMCRRFIPRLLKRRRRKWRQEQRSKALETSERQGGKQQSKVKALNTLTTRLKFGFAKWLRVEYHFELTFLVNL